MVTGDISGTKADAIIVNYYEGSKRLDGVLAAIDKTLGGSVSLLVKQGEIKGKCGETTIMHTLGKLPSDRLVIAGLGKQAELTAEKIRGAIATTCRLLRRKNISTVASVVYGTGSTGLSIESAAQAMTEGVLLGLYEFRRHITKEAEYGEIKSLSIVGVQRSDAAALKSGVEKGRILAEAANMARDMVNEPSNEMTPADMAEVAITLAKTHSLKIEVLEREQVEKMGMGAFLGVARGSQQPPKFIVLNYKGSRSGGIDIALVGKGITFDSGGISIKPSEGMGEMKSDMSGAAAVIAAMGAIAQLKPAINVLAVVAATENMPSGTAFKPGDILKSMSGKTIEIITTDAEGRLTLADAIEYARKKESKLIIDVATLTGACVVALGDICTGAFSNDQESMDKVLAASIQAGEHTWQMPMFDEYKEQNKSDVADLKNTGGRPAGAITAAKFLAEFAGDTHWVHLDIAGTNMTDKEKGYLVKGATGTPTRTLVNLVLSLARK